MDRRSFLHATTFASAGMLMPKLLHATVKEYPDVRTPANQRKFTSKAVEDTIANFRKFTSNAELGWLFENCFPNNLDTTFEFEIL